MLKHNHRCCWRILLTLLVAASLTGVNTSSTYAGDQPMPVTKESSATFRRVVKKVLPAVVSITSKAKQLSREESDERRREFRRRFEGFEDQVPEEFKRFFEDFNFDNHPPIPRGGFGSGVIMSADGIVLTNNHVVAGAERVEITLQDGRKFIGKSVVADPKTDVAIVKLDPKDAKNLPVATFGDSSKLEIGDWVLAMGAPFQLSGSVSAGIVSAKGRPLGMTMYEDFIQTDAAINPGNSGGPIVNLDGQVVGINTAIRTRTGTFAGIGFAVPSSIARSVMKELIEHGRVRRGYVGIQMGPARQEVLDRLELSHGLVISNLTAGETPARKAGLKPLDIILSINGTEVKDSRALQTVVSRTPPGKKLNFKIFRDGKVVDVAVTIEEQPEKFGLARQFVRPRRRPQPRDEAIEIGAVGIRVQQVTPELAKRFGHDESTKGVIVTEVKPDSLAAKANLTRGSLIQQVEQKDVKNPEALAKILADVDLKEGALMKVIDADGSARLIVVKKAE